MQREPLDTSAVRAATRPTYKSSLTLWSADDAAEFLNDAASLRTAAFGSHLWAQNGPE